MQASCQSDRSTQEQELKANGCQEFGILTPKEMDDDMFGVLKRTTACFVKLVCADYMEAESATVGKLGALMRKGVMIDAEPANQVLSVRWLFLPSLHPRKPEKLAR